MKDDAKKLQNVICYTRLDIEFMKAMEKLRTFSPELANWLENKGDINKWVKSQFPHQ